MTSMIFAEVLIDAIAFGVMVASIAIYHAYLRRLAKREPSAVLARVAAEARAAWVETMLASPDSGLLAVQTLRNSTMAATFLASTAILLMIGVLTLSGQGAALKDTWHALNLSGTLSPEVWLLKILLMLATLFFAFFSFSNAVRVYNHVGYLMTARAPGGTPGYPVPLVAAELNRAGRYFSLGMRAYYYLVPLVCWLFGPLYMIVAALVLVGLLLPRVDKVTIRSNST